MPTRHGREFKGYYCKSCHTYTRLYRREQSINYYGRCPRCGKEIALEAQGSEEQFFFTGGAPYRTINIWDSYMQGKIIGQVDAGTRANVLGKETYRGVIWYHVRAGSQKGWVSGMFIRHLR